MDDTPIGYTIEFDIRSGAVDAFREAAEEAIELAKDEPGTRQYEWFLNAEQGTCTTVEQFSDQAGAVAHVTGSVVEKVLPKLLEASDIRSIRLLGTPGPELEKALEGFPVTSRSAFIGGFDR